MEKYKQIIDFNGYHVAGITQNNTLIISTMWAKVAGLKIKKVESFGDVKPSD